MKIGIFEAEQRDKDFFSKALKGHKLIFDAKPLTEANAAKYREIEVACIFIYSKINAAALKKLPRLKFVTTRSTGFDHIDAGLCKSNGIKVCNVPFYGENTVAEHAFGLMLSLSRNIHRSYVKTLKNDFSIEGLMGFDLKGKTLGVIGAGHIGMHLIRMAEGFGMNVLAYDLFPNDFLAEEMHFTYSKDLDLVLKSSDIISLHLPSLPSTFHIINKKRIAAMRKGAIIINTARGDLIDTEALFDALKKGHLGGAGLDVIEGEDVIKEEPEKLRHENREKLKRLHKEIKLFHLPNVVFTPHIAFFSREALERIMQTTADNILNFTEGKQGGNEVKAGK